MNTRRRLLVAFCAAAFAGAASAGDVIEVYKSLSCGCCTKWLEHLREHAFEVRAHDVPEPSLYRARFGVPERLGSCHTATVAGYSLEGHVPAREIRRLLAERPKAAGLAVPGMPLGSPGMEGDHTQPYDVLLFTAGGRTSIYRRYP